MNLRVKNLNLLFLVAFLVLLMPRQAYAYIGPGAGFALMGSFLARFTAIFSAVIAIFIWPIRQLSLSVSIIPKEERKYQALTGG